MSLFGSLALTRHFLYDKSVTGHLMIGWSLLVPDTSFSMHVCIDQGLTGRPAFSSVLQPRIPLPFFTSDARPSQVSSSSDLLVGWRRIERDCEQSSLSFHLEGQDVLSCSLGGSCPDPPCAVLSGTA